MNIGSLPPAAAVAVQTARQAAQAYQFSESAQSQDQIQTSSATPRTLIDASAVPIEVMSGRGRIVDTQA